MNAGEPSPQRFVSRSADETRSRGVELARRLRVGDRVDLVGPLGAGKTVFVKGIAYGLGLAADFPVTSPTFARMNLYPTTPPLYHWDLYRVADGASASAELCAIGFDEEVLGPGVVVVEWADRLVGANAARYRRAATVSVRIAYGEARDERLIEIVA